MVSRSRSMPLLLDMWQPQRLPVDSHSIRSPGPRLGLPGIPRHGRGPDAGAKGTKPLTLAYRSGASYSSRTATDQRGMPPMVRARGGWWVALGAGPKPTGNGLEATGR